MQFLIHQRSVHQFVTIKVKGQKYSDVLPMSVHKSYIENKSSAALYSHTVIFNVSFYTCS